MHESLYKHDLEVEKERHAKTKQQRDDLLDACKALFEHCCMVHKHWGENCNQKQASAAIEAGHKAIAKATN